MLKRQSDALPAIERLVLQLVARHRVEVLAQHPEAGVCRAKVYLLDVVHAAGGARQDGLKILVSIHLPVGKAELLAFALSQCSVLLLTDPFNLRWISFKHMFGVIDRLSIINIKIAARRIEFYKHVEASEVLNYLLQRVVEFEPHQPLALEVVHHVEDFFDVAFALIDLLFAFLIGLPMVARGRIIEFVLRSNFLIANLCNSVSNFYCFSVLN